MTIIKLAELAPTATWAAKHLEFVRAAQDQIVSHLETLSDKQLAVEYAEVLRLSGFAESDGFLLGLYTGERNKRPYRPSPSPANAAVDDSIPF